MFPRAMAFIARRPTLARLLFNCALRSPNAPTRPNAWLAEAVRGVKPGRALDIAMGAARNAKYLATQGWQVTGIDVSQAAVKAAQRAGVHAVLSTAGDFDYGQHEWDLVVLCYAWVRIGDFELAGRIKRSVRPGGLVVFEHFLHTGPESPPREAGTVESGELKMLFADFDIAAYQEVLAEPDWLPPMTRKSLRPLVRMVARKK